MLRHVARGNPVNRGSRGYVYHSVCASSDPTYVIATTYTVHDCIHCGERGSIAPRLNSERAKCANTRRGGETSARRLHVYPCSAAPLNVDVLGGVAVLLLVPNVVP